MSDSRGASTDPRRRARGRRAGRRRADRRVRLSPTVARRTLAAGQHDQQRRWGRGRRGRRFAGAVRAGRPAGLERAAPARRRDPGRFRHVSRRPGGVPAGTAEPGGAGAPDRGRAGRGAADRDRDREPGPRSRRRTVPGRPAAARHDPERAADRLGRAREVADVVLAGPGRARTRRDGPRAGRARATADPVRGRAEPAGRDRGRRAARRAVPDRVAAARRSRRPDPDPDRCRRHRPSRRRHRPAPTPGAPPAQPLELAHLLEADGYLFARYLRAAGPR